MQYIFFTIGKLLYNVLDIFKGYQKCIRLFWAFWNIGIEVFPNY